MKIKCKSCGERFDPDQSGYWLDGVGDVCDECWYSESKECQLCGERFGQSRISDYVLIKSQLSLPDRLPGIYMVLHYPFLLCPMIGSTSLFENDVLFVDALPSPDDSFEISGNICLTCAKPYDRKRIAGYRLPRKWLFGHSEQSWALERHHTRKVFIGNPERVKDLELSPTDDTWIELRERYLLPSMETFRPWLCLEYRGVKVYYQRSPKDHSSWVTTNPDPEFRNSYKGRPTNFSAHELPTWRLPRYKDYQYEYPEEDREALILAIDRGLLTQNGLAEVTK